jgi:hypothetical protein
LGVHAESVTLWSVRAIWQSCDSGSREFAV